MPRLKCTYCGDRFEKETMRRFPVGNFCSWDHAVKYGTEKSNKLRRKKEKNEIKERSKAVARRKREFQAGDVRIRAKAAKTACHKYINLRDAGKPCICCGRKINGAVHAGHWLESGNNPKIRYHEDNIHAQSSHCNFFKGGDSGDYQKNLRNKIGNERVDWLQENKGGTMKRTAQDYKEIEDYYKAKIKELQRA